MAFRSLEVGRKIERITKDLSERIAAWDCVDAITIAESAQADFDDPYFFVSLDVFYSGEVPPLDVRRKVFQDAGAFESSTVAMKDRFLIDGVPVRIEYKDKSRIDEVLTQVEKNLWVFRQTGTYMFYRLQTGTVLFQRSDWIEQTRQRLGKLPDSFWRLLAASCQATMEHYLSDLNAAVFRNDDFFYLISRAGFIKSFCSMLFVLNRRFEPSGRKLLEQIFSLPRLPENFRGRFESFITEDPEFPPLRKREVAELLAKSIIPIMIQ